MKWTSFRVEKVKDGYLVSVYLDFVVNEEEPDFGVVGCAGYQKNYEFSTTEEVEELLVNLVKLGEKQDDMGNVRS